MKLKRYLKHDILRTRRISSKSLVLNKSFFKFFATGKYIYIFLSQKRKKAQNIRE